MHQHFIYIRTTLAIRLLVLAGLAAALFASTGVGHVLGRAAAVVDQVSFVEVGLRGDGVGDERSSKHGR